MPEHHLLSHILGDDGSLPLASQLVQSTRAILLTASSLAPGATSSSPSSSSRAFQSFFLLFVLTSVDFSSLGRHHQNPSLQYSNNSSSSFQYPLELHNYSYSAQLNIHPRKKHTKKQNLFHHNPHALNHLSPIPFQEEWINDFNVAPHPVNDSMSQWVMPEAPQELPVPDYVDVFDLSSSVAQKSLRQVGQQARHLIDQHLHQNSGAMLFRNLQQVIHNASDFATFWNHVHSGSSSDNGNWNIMADHLSCYNRKRQRLYNKVDRVDTDVPSITIGPHNEHSCNPHASDKIFFYALHTAAQGGESLLRRNQDMQVPEEAWHILQEQNKLHGGALQFTRTYPDMKTLQETPVDERHPTEMSWQERCQTESAMAAKQYFQQHHDIRNVTFSTRDQSLTAQNLLPGYYYQDENGSEASQRQDRNAVRPGVVWFNRIDYGFPVLLADGTTFPLNLQAYLKRQKWHETTAFKLQPGDWLVLDNKRVQHGRLPYQDATSNNKPRQLLVTYTASEEPTS